MIRVIIIILLILFLFWLYTGYTENRVEGFHWDPLWEGRDSQDCYKESLGNCLKYSNCGICNKGGQLKCLPGDMNGAFFDERCDNWTYKDQYERNIFNENVTRTTPQWSKFYFGDYETHYPSPVATAALQSFREQATPPPYPH